MPGCCKRTNIAMTWVTSRATSAPLLISPWPTNATATWFANISKPRLMNFEDRRIECSAPGRCGIIGNPTDMYGGSVLSCSIGLRARVKITPADTLTLVTNDSECHITSRKDLRPREDLFDLPRAILDYMRLPQ